MCVCVRPHRFMYGINGHSLRWENPLQSIYPEGNGKIKMQNCIKPSQSFQFMSIFLCAFNIEPSFIFCRQNKSARINCKNEICSKCERISYKLNIYTFQHNIYSNSIFRISIQLATFKVTTFFNLPITELGVPLWLNPTHSREATGENCRHFTHSNWSSVWKKKKKNVIHFIIYSRSKQYSTIYTLRCLRCIRKSNLPDFTAVDREINDKF